MIHHFRARIFSRLLLSPCSCRSPASRIPPPFSPQRLLSASTISPKPFAVEEYLVATCGLTQPQALKASKRLYHLKPPCNPDAVLAFLSGLGMPRSDIATLVVRDPLFLCSSVEKTLAPRVADLTDLGLSRPQIARLISVALNSFRTKSLCGNFSFWISVFDGSFETFLRAFMLNAGILKVSIEKVAMPNLDFLQQCGISVSEFAVMNKYSSRVFCLKPMALREAAERVEELGIKCGSWMFRHALSFMALMRKEDFSKKIELLHKIGFSQDDALVVVRKAPSVLSLSDKKIRQVMYFLTKIGFSQDDALVVVRKAPSVLSFSDKKIRKVMDFLTENVGLEAPYIARRPALFTYSLERRLMPRYFLLKVLREKGFMNAELDYFNTITVGEKLFVQKFVHPYKDHVPGLTDDYASICSRTTA